MGGKRTFDCCGSTHTLERRSRPTDRLFRSRSRIWERHSWPGLRQEADISDHGIHLPAGGACCAEGANGGLCRSLLAASGTVVRAYQVRWRSYRQSNTPDPEVAIISTSSFKRCRSSSDLGCGRLHVSAMVIKLQRVASTMNEHEIAIYALQVGHARASRDRQAKPSSEDCSTILILREPWPIVSRFLD